MVKKKITNAEIEFLSNATTFNFPKYTTQIINLVNSNAQGTRPAVVGQMSELIQEFDGKSLTEWIEWYSQKEPNAIEAATKKIYDKFVEMKAAADLITIDMIQNWVKDLVFTKTYCGLKFQDAIIAFLGNSLNKSYRLATPAEEARNIDGYIGSTPVQIKSSTYKIEGHLSEVIECPVIYYEKKKDGISIEYNEKDFV